jgi:hypothetical protein
MPERDVEMAGTLTSAGAGHIRALTLLSSSSTPERDGEMAGTLTSAGAGHISALLSSSSTPERDGEMAGTLTSVGAGHISALLSECSSTPEQDDEEVEDNWEVVEELCPLPKDSNE